MLSYSVTDPNFKVTTVTSSTKNWEKIAPIQFYADSSAYFVVKIVKKNSNINVLLSSQSEFIKKDVGEHLETLKALPDGEYLYDPSKNKIILDFATNKKSGFWTVAPRKIFEGSYTETYFGVGNDENFYKAFRDESLVVPLAYTYSRIYFVNKVSKITDEGILLLLKYVERKLNVRPGNYRNYVENLKTEVGKIQLKGPIPTEKLKLNNLLRALKKTKTDSPQLDLFDDKILTISYIADYGIPPNIKEYAEVNMDISIDHVNQVFTQGGKLYVYTFDEIETESIAEFLSVPPEKIVLVKTVER